MKFAESRIWLGFFFGFEVTLVEPLRKIFPFPRRTVNLWKYGSQDSAMCLILRSQKFLFNISAKFYITWNTVQYIPEYGLNRCGADCLLNKSSTVINLVQLCLCNKKNLSFCTLSRKMLRYPPLWLLAVLRTRSRIIFLEPEPQRDAAPASVQN
jgi:hypothetical protein